MPDLILASSSPYRRELLPRLHLPFECASPDIDESHRCRAKAPSNWCAAWRPARRAALAQRYPQHLIIGSDQVAVLGSNILGKPHTPERAIQQLQDASGKSVTFLTGLGLLNSQSGGAQVACVPFTVHFRHLDESRIRRYVEAEHPLDCAGSFKAEGLGVSLFRSTEGEDATSLMGLPLIRLVDMLLAEQVPVP